MTAARQNKIQFLVVAGGLSFFASIMHIAIIIGGPDWYRFFGAGEAMAQMAEQGSIQPATTTSIIALILASWGAFAWSGAGILPRLPLLKTALICITAVYITRALAGFFLAFFSNNPYILELGTVFWLLSSFICLGFGLTHLKGIIDAWPDLKR